MRNDEFEWDDRKAKRNERQHGVTFELARLIFDDPNAIASTYAVAVLLALRVPLERPGDPPSRRVARIAGTFMVLTFISIPGLPLYDQVLNHTNFVLGAGGDTRVYVGALFEILTS